MVRSIRSKQAAKSSTANLMSWRASAGRAVAGAPMYQSRRVSDQASIRPSVMTTYSAVKAVSKTS